MSDSYSFVVESADTIRLKTAGKYCDRDLYVTGFGNDGSGVTASEGDVLAGKKFVDSNGELKDGEIPVIQDASVLLSPSKAEYKIPKGYHSGNGSVGVSYDQFEVTPSKQTQILPGSGSNTFIGQVTVNPIPDQYIVPSGTKDITGNGTHDVTEFASVNVNVESGGGGAEPTPTQEKTVDIMANGTVEVTPDEGYALSKVTANVNVPSKEPNIQPLEVTKNGSYTPIDGVDGFSPVTVHVEGGDSDQEIDALVGLIENTTVDFESQKITKLSQYAFAYRTGLRHISLPNLKSSQTRAFTNCESLTYLSIPNMSGYTYQYMAAYCGSLQTADVRNASYISSYSFYSCANLTKMEFNRVGTIATNAFNGCTKLATLILRSGSVVTLGGTSAFTGTKIAGTGGYIYVPKTLDDGSDGVAAYEAATNWSTYAGKGKFRAIEDYPDITGG